ncbi:MAG: PD40 domain-containing protein, partial [Bacteroidetes bacterium]|nr:PD40 domain-containing protein [Bacteroidota bacterium]
QGNPKSGGSGDIFCATKISDEEEVVERLPGKINTKYWESHPFITNDGNTLYFVSDRPGGIGGRDIYVSNKTTSGKWQPAKNIGKPVNTEHDEASPYFNSDANILYFSSKGHPGMGGYDIFKTTLKEENWVDPVNLGYPINHESDDIFFRLTPSGWSAYFSTVREGGYGGLDLYKVVFPEPMIKFITLMGQVSDVSFSKFKFVNLSADMINKIGLIDESKVTAERKYKVKGITIGEFDKNNTFTFKNLTPDEITKLSYAKSSNITAEGKYVVEGTVIGSWDEKGVFSFANLDADGIARLGLKASDFQSGTTQGMPAQFKKVDSNGDLCISANEIYAAIDAYFEGDRSFTVDMLFKLIDYFFVQEC